MKRFFYAILIVSLIMCSLKANAETAETMYAQAYGQLYKGNSQEAVKILEKALNIYPDCAFLYAGLGDAYLKQGNLDKSINYYTLAQRKKNASELYKIDFYNATLIKDMKDINKALDTLIATTKISDNSTLFLNAKYILNEEYEKTVLMTDMYYNATDEELTKNNNLKAAGKREEALQGYLKILNSNPKNFQAANNVGVTFFELKDYQLAEKYLKQALNINKTPIILNNLAVVNLYQKNYKDMETNLAEALNLKDDYICAINNKVIGNIHKDLSFFQPQNAESLLDIVKRENQNFYASRTLAKIYFIKGDYNSANNILTPLNSDYNFKLYTQKSYVSLKNRTYRDALNYSNKAISLYSDNSSDYVIRGRIYTETNRYQEAQSDFKKALSKNKNDANIYYYMAKTFNKSGDIDNSTILLKKYVDLKKGNAQSANLNKLL